MTPETNPRPSGVCDGSVIEQRDSLISIKTIMSFDSQEGRLVFVLGKGVRVYCVEEDYRLLHCTFSWNHPGPRLNNLSLRTNRRSNNRKEKKKILGRTRRWYIHVQYLTYRFFVRRGSFRIFPIKERKVTSLDNLLGGLCLD